MSDKYEIPADFSLIQFVLKAGDIGRDTKAATETIKNDLMPMYKQVKSKHSSYIDATNDKGQAIKLQLGMGAGFSQALTTALDIKRCQICEVTSIDDLPEKYSSEQKKAISQWSTGAVATMRVLAGRAMNQLIEDVGGFDCKVKTGLSLVLDRGTMDFKTTSWTFKFESLESVEDKIVRLLKEANILLEENPHLSAKTLVARAKKEAKAEIQAKVEAAEEESTKAIEDAVPALGKKQAA